MRKKSAVKIVLNVLFILLMAGICICIALGVYSRVTGKSVLPYSVLWVLTDSMEDTIPARSYILVKRAEPGEIRVGDIITFRSRDAALGGSLNTHRVTEIVGDHEAFVTKGDRVGAAVDPQKVLPEDIQAVYVRNLPVLTFFGRVFTSPVGFVICLLLMLAGMAFWFCRYFLQLRKASKQAVFDRLVEEEVARLEENERKRKESHPQDGDGSQKSD